MHIHFADSNIKKSKMFRTTPPGFPKPLWRGWEGGAGSMANAGVRSDLAVAVTTIERSLGGCHREEVRRDPTECPGSNQHHYVRQQPHRCEILPVTARKKEIEGNLYSAISSFFNLRTMFLFLIRLPQIRKHESPDGYEFCCSV